MSSARSLHHKQGTRLDLHKTTHLLVGTLFLVVSHFATNRANTPALALVARFALIVSRAVSIKLLVITFTQICVQRTVYIFRYKGNVLRQVEARLVGLVAVVVRVSCRVC